MCCFLIGGLPLVNCAQRSTGASRMSGEWKMCSLRLMSATLLLFTVCHFQLCASDAMFTVQPQNQTVPLNTVVEFTCDGVGHDVVWLVYLPGQPLLTSDTKRDQLQARGVTITESDTEGVNLTHLQLTGTIDKNSTRVRCRIFNGNTVFSDTATLTLIGPPLAPQPSVTPLSKSEISITWNEPFTWEGFPVLHYDFSIYRVSDNQLIRSVRTTQREYVALQSDLQGADCTVYLFVVQASSIVGSGAEGNVPGGFPIAPDSFLETNVGIEVTFNQEGDPRVMITIEHPDVCPYQTIDYSVVIELTGVNTSLRGASRIELEFPNRQPPQGALVYEIVDTKLVPSKEYTAVVVASTIAGNASTIVLFETYFDPGTTSSNSGNPALIGAVAGAALVALLVAVGILVCVVACCCCSRRKKSIAPDSIKNPYDVQPKVIERSPVEMAYESIDQYQTHALRRPESPYQSMVPVTDPIPALPADRKSQIIEQPATPSAATYDKNINQCSNVETVPVRLEATNRPECYYSIVSEDFYTTMDSAGTLASQSQLSQDTAYAVNLPDNDTTDPRYSTEC